MTKFTSDDRKAMLSQIASEREAVFQDIRKDLAGVVAKMDAATDAALFADGKEPQFFEMMRNAINAYNMNVPLPTAAAEKGEADNG